MALTFITRRMRRLGRAPADGVRPNFINERDALAAVVEAERDALDVGKVVARHETTLAAMASAARPALGLNDKASTAEVLAALALKRSKDAQAASADRFAFGGAICEADGTPLPLVTITGGAALGTAPAQAPVFIPGVGQPGGAENRASRFRLQLTYGTALPGTVGLACSVRWGVRTIANGVWPSYTVGYAQLGGIWPNGATVPTGWDDNGNELAHFWAVPVPHGDGTRCIGVDIWGLIPGAMSTAKSNILVSALV